MARQALFSLGQGKFRLKQSKSRFAALPDHSRMHNPIQQNFAARVWQGNRTTPPDNAAGNRRNDLPHRRSDLEMSGSFTLHNATVNGQFQSPIGFVPANRRAVRRFGEHYVAAMLHRFQYHARSSFTSARPHAAASSRWTMSAESTLLCARKLCSRPSKPQPLRGQR